MAPDTAARSLATVRRFMAATGAERQNERCSLLHDDFVVHEAGGLPFSGDYHGSQGFFELLHRMNDVLELKAGPITTDALGNDAVAARFRLTFISRASGKSVQMGLVEIYTVRDGRIAELDVYYKDPAAVAALLAAAP
jgi:ketosteroid isomerase-like protein